MSRVDERMDEWLDERVASMTVDREYSDDELARMREWCAGSTAAAVTRVNFAGAEALDAATPRWFKRLTGMTP